jgi:hypothetical protein
MDAVSAWPDSSAQANDATVPAGTTSPVFHTSGAAINNQPYVTFDQPSVNRLVSQNNVGSFTDFTFFVVFRNDGSRGQYDAIFGQNWWDGIKLTRNGDAVDEWTTYIVGNNGNHSTAVDGSWHLYASGRSGADNTSWWNGTSTGTTAVNSTATTDEKIAIGCMPNPVPWGRQNFGGDVAEAVAYSSYLSASDREAIECYLGTKYGLALGHACP